MRICLGIDASAQESSVAIAVDGVLQAEEVSATGPSGEVLLVLLQRALQSASLTPRDIQEIAVGIGPGSFTGIRNGIATAQGFASPSNLPVLGVSGLLALAEPQASEYSLVAYTANHQEFFAAFFSGQLGAPGEVELHIESGALTIPQSDLHTVRPLELFSEERANWPVKTSVFSENPLRFQKSLAARMACLSFRPPLIGMGGLGRVEEKQALIQRTEAGRGLSPVYAKPVNAKTLAERGLSL